MPVAMKSDRSHSPLSAKTSVGTIEPPIKAGNNCSGRSGPPKASCDQQALQHGHGEKQQSNKADKLANQIFVGGIPLKTSPQRFREWADETWPGLVAGVRLICTFEKAVPAKRTDAKDTAMASKPRGFGFVTFISSDAASHAVQNQHYVFSGERTVEVKKVHKAALIFCTFFLTYVSDFQAEDTRGSKQLSAKPAPTSNDAEAVPPSDPDVVAPSPARQLGTTSPSSRANSAELEIPTNAVHIEANPQTKTAESRQDAAADCCNAASSSRGPVPRKHKPQQPTQPQQAPTAAAPRPQANGHGDKAPRPPGPRPVPAVEAVPGQKPVQQASAPAPADAGPQSPSPPTTAPWMSSTAGADAIASSSSPPTTPPGAAERHAGPPGKASGPTYDSASRRFLR
jgi:hypothetical protein